MMDEKEMKMKKKIKKVEMPKKKDMMMKNMAIGAEANTKRRGR